LRDGYRGRFPASDTFSVFLLTSTGQAGFIQVEIPNLGNSHPCSKNQNARMTTKIKTSFIFISFLHPQFK